MSRNTLCILVVIGFLGVSCGGDILTVSDPFAETDTVSQQLTSPSGSVVVRGNCTPGQVSDAQLAQFEGLLPAILAEGRRAANSVAFRTCLHQILEVGGVSMPNDSNGVYGPYCPPSFACGIPTNRDRGYELTSTMSTAELRYLYAERARAESLSPNPIKVICNDTLPFGAAAGVEQNETNDRAGPEDFHVSVDLILTTIAGETTGSARDRVVSRASSAAIFWHEAVHTHDYHHCGVGADTGIAAAACDAFKLRQIPHVVGACLRDVIVETHDNGCSACGSGYYPVQADFKSGACSCVVDPEEAIAWPPSHTWTSNSTSTAPNVVVDSFETAYMYHGTVAYVWDPASSGWGVAAVVGTGGQQWAGGATHAYRKWDGRLYRRVMGGAATLVGSASVNSVAIDDFGTMYRKTVSGVQQLLLGSSSWTTVGGPVQAFWAGGDKLYATDPSTLGVWRFNHIASTWSATGGPGYAFDVDSYGTLHGIAPDQSVLLQNRGGSTWDSIGGSADRVRAGNRLYATAPGSTDIYRRHGDGQWLYAASCDNFAIGGNVLYCVRRQVPGCTGSCVWLVERYDR